MTYIDDLIKICDEVKHSEYKNKSSLKWLNGQIVESIRIIQLIELSTIDIRTTQYIDNIYDIIKKSKDWVLMKDRFTDTAKELTHELQGFINWYT